MTDYNSNPFPNDPERKNCQIHDDESKFLTYTMGATLAGVLFFCGLKEGCKRIDKYEKAKDRHIQEKYNPKGLQKKIEQERE
ncbi:hypothetical protein GF378_02585 [Candidatus Pacearchaeota archaeon]|nr:hypothetical protein [Candidatus Pacearchaeota archaeon]